jgi:hypothetical protein
MFIFKDYLQNYMNLNIKNYLITKKIAFYKVYVNFCKLMKFLNKYNII